MWMVQGTIGQVLALAMRANAALGGREPGPDWRDADAFRFCRSVRFAVARRGTPQILAWDPDHWLGRLSGVGALGVKARVICADPVEEMRTTGFIGGGSLWLLETILPGGGSRWWRADWRLAALGNSPDPWEVTYWHVAPPEALPAERSLKAIEAELRDSLYAIAAFAADCAPDWESSFRDALALLDGQAEKAVRDALAPDGLLSQEAERPFEACRTAWVFGGMGSWSDGGFTEGQAEEAERLGARLFALLQEGLAAAANSSLPAPPELG
jgi:hypothetical protein